MALILIALLSIFGIRSYDNSKKYKNLVITADKYMEEKDYDKAIEKFKESLDYKKDETTDEKIEKCKEELINLSQKELKNKKYEKSNNYLDVVIKYDEKNKDAIKIQKDIKDKIQKDKYEEERKKEEEEVRKRIEEEVKKQVRSNTEKTKNKNIVKKDNRVTKEKAEALIKTIKNKDEKIEFLGIENVPNIPKDSIPYRKFPKEIENKKVYIFDAFIEYNTDDCVTVGRYYVDFNGNIYKDTYPSNLECVRVK